MAQNGNLKINSFLFVLLLLVAGCNSDGQKKETTKSQNKSTPTNIKAPPFNADSAYSYVQKQVDFGPRVPNTEAHKKAGDYLSKKLGSYGFNIIDQKATLTAFDGKRLAIKNIIGEYRPELNNRVLLLSHWDSRPFADQDTINKDQAIDGANDGASGVGILLEIARQIQQLEPNIGVDIIFFDAEDYGEPSADHYGNGMDNWCLGSQYWSKHLHKPNYNANFGILLDMVGAKNAIFTKESISMHYAPQIVNKVWNIATKIGHGNHFVFQETRHVGVDDHYYVNKITKIPTIDIIQYDPNTGAFAPHWHTHQDNMQVIDKNTLKAVGETVLATVLQTAK